MRPLSINLSLLLVLLQFIFGEDCVGQTYPRWENGRLNTFEIPRSPQPRPSDMDAWRILQEVNQRKALKVYEEKAFELIQKFNTGIKLLSEPQGSFAAKQYVKEYLQSLFLNSETAAPRKNPTYQGLAYDEFSNSIISSSNFTLENYLEYLVELYKNNQRVNICWGLPEDAEAIKFKGTATRRLRNASEFTLLNDKVVRDYMPYKANLCIKEYAAFNIGGFPQEKEVCKNIVFELRCFERKNYDPQELTSLEEAYFWTVTLSSIRVTSPGNKCCKKMEVTCDGGEDGPGPGRDTVKQLTFKFDFGPGPEKKDYAKVDAQRMYTKKSGYGLLSQEGVDAVSACQTTGDYCDNELDEDYLIFKEATKFKVDLPNGSYFVRYHFRSLQGEYEPKPYKLVLNGRYFSVRPKSNTVSSNSFKVKIKDQTLILGFQTLGGKNSLSEFPINGLVITPNANNFDFGPGLTQDTFIQILADTKYSKVQGFGILDLSKVRTDFENCQSDGHTIYCDHVTFLEGGVFKVDRPNGPYSVSVLSQKPLDLKALRIEDKKRKPRKKKNNTSEYVFDIVVEDKSIDFSFNDESTPINGIIIRSGNCSKIVPGWTYAIPGLGFNAIRKRKGKKFFIWPAITALSYGAFAASIHYKMESHEQYGIHKRARTFERSNLYYDMANKNHHKFLAYLSAGVLIWGVSD
ncbi:MAG: hypothetical protein AAF985_20265, partial [Bacteroidota bacterium]